MQELSIKTARQRQVVVGCMLVMQDHIQDSRMLVKSESQYKMNTGRRQPEVAAR